LLACVGRDELARRGREAVDREGVRTEGIVSSATGLGSSYVVGIVDERGERQLYTYAGASEELRPEHLSPAVLDGVTHIHICTLGAEFVERALALAKGAYLPIVVSVDPGALGMVPGRGERLRVLLPGVDLLFLNTIELRALMGIQDPLALERHADALPARVAVKLGADGCVLYRRGAAPVAAPAFAVDTLDTTGAGDAFAAGYLAGWMWGLPDHQLAVFSNAVAALSTTAIGCRDGLPTRAQIKAFLQARGHAIV
jgi:ribokinase